MSSRAGSLVRRLTGAMAALVCLSLGGKALAQQTTLCAVVKLEIQQKAALEREAFDAHLVVNNNVVNQPLTNLKVQVFVKDATGASADASFFVKVTTLTGTNAVDGTGVVQSSSTADIHWLIIPSSGTGGANPLGQQYAVSALITGVSNGVQQQVTTFDAFITVHPQPLIRLEYALPYEVFADEPLTPQIEPIEPFPLGVRVTNVGYGTARNFQIQSAQPQIVENKQGLAIDFKLLGTVLSGKQVPNSLLIPFGDVPPQGAALGEWMMSTTLSGRFISFTSTFTHAADLGGQLTSLLQSVTTYTLLKDVLVDLPGRDQVPDFLVNTSMDRGAMQAVLDGGAQPPAELILESDQPVPLPVAEVPGALSGTLGGGSASLTFSFSQGVGSNIWVHGTAPWPYGKAAKLAGARRSDGKAINPANVWISKHFRKSDLSTIYWINVLDLSSAGASYALQFSSAGLDLPPGAVTDLAAAGGAAGGSVALTWTSPGEDGYVGNLFGARTLIEAETAPSAAFSPASAQINFATAAVQGARQSYLAGGLVGNATQYVYLWTQDAGGNMAPISNGATAYALPYPPTGLAFAEVDPSSMTVTWQGGNNALPIAYSVRMSSVSGGPTISSSPFQDPFTRAFTFTGLAPGGTYYIYGVAQNPATGVSSPLALLGSTRTTGGVRVQDMLPPRTSLVVGSPRYGASPLYVSGATPLSLAAVDDLAAVGDGKGVGVARTYYAVDAATYAAYSGTFTLVAEGTHTVTFYSTDLAGNAEVARSSVVAADNTPPATTLQVSGSSSTDAQGVTHLQSSSLLGLAASDPPSRGVASGAATTYFLIDVATQACAGGLFASSPDPLAAPGTCRNPVFAAPFSLPVGTHTIVFASVDNVGNAEPVRFLSLAVSPPPPPDPRQTPFYKFAFKFGQPGSGLGQFNHPYDADLDPDDNLYVADRSNRRIQKFSASGQYLTSWNSQPPGVVGLPLGVGVSVDTLNRRVAVADEAQNTVRVFDSTGTFLFQVGPNVGGTYIYVTDVAFGPTGSIYISDQMGRIVKVDRNGNWLKSWGVPTSLPYRLAVDAQDNVYATIYQGGVAKFDGQGSLLAQWGSPGTAPGQFDDLRGIALDAYGNVYTVENGSGFGVSRVQIFTSTGGFLTQFGARGSSYDGALMSPDGLGVSPVTGKVYVADTANNRIQVFAVDVTSPAAPAVLSPSNGSTILVPRPLVLIRAEPASTLSISVDGTPALSVAVPPSGIVQTHLPQPLAPGPHVLMAQARDAAGLASPSVSAGFTNRAPNQIAFQPPAITSVQAPYGSFGTTVTVAGDFNGDGKVDVVALGVQFFSTFLGQGDGTFTELQPAYIGSTPTDAAAVDINKDGKLDIVYVSNGGQGPVLGVLLGNGDGTFQPAKTMPINQSGQMSLAVGDFNEDGQVDVAVADGSVDIYLGNGDGTFQAPRVLPNSGGLIRGVKAADFNRDGHLDLVSGNLVFFGNGKGDFPTTAALPTPASTVGVPTIADFNNDGNPDVMVFNTFPFTNQYFALAGLGDGTFVLVSSGTVPAGILSSAHADFNRDGNQDVAVGGFSGFVAILTGNGDGTFAPGPTLNTGYGLANLSNLTLTDLNKDNAIDLVAALNLAPRNPEFAVFLNATVAPDVIPPAAVANLAASAAVDGRVLLTWTATGNDGTVGQAASYDIRQATFAITAASFASAASVPNPPVPQVSGAAESLAVAGLSGGATWYFALKAVDPAGNVAGISNVASLRTPYLTASGAAVNGKPELAFVNSSIQATATVLTSGTAQGALVLASATAQGFALVSTVYNLGPEGATFSPAATLLMRFSTAALAAVGVLPQDVALYRFDAVAGWVKVPGQTLDLANAQVSAPLSMIASIYAILGTVRDLTPPRTSLALTGPRFADPAGRLYASSSTALGFSAFDPVVFGTASGVAFTQFRLDAAVSTAPFARFGSPLTLSEGWHVVDFYSQDNAGNAEPVQSSTVAVDATPPRTTLSLTGPGLLLAASTTYLVSTGTALGFQALDPVVKGVASGISTISYRLDGGAWTVFSGTFTLAPGSHALDFGAVDNVGNAEAAQRVTIAVDTAAPSIALLAPRGGEKFVASQSTVAIRFQVADALDPAPTFYALLVEVQDQGTPRGALPAVIPVANGQTIDPLAIDDGLWQLRIVAANVAGLSTTAVSGLFQVVHDTMPPRTTLAVGAPQAPSGPAGSLFVTRVTSFTIASIDDLVAPNDGIGLGVASQTVSVDGLARASFANPSPAPGAVFSSSFTLAADADGLHVLGYGAQDVLMNQETVHFTTVAIDNTPPATQLLVSTPSAVAFVSRASVLSLLAADPVVNGVASGVRFTQYRVNGGAFSLSPASFTLAGPDGAYRVDYQSQDSVANVEVLKSTTVLLDATAPQTALALASGRQFPGPDGATFYASSDTRLALPAVDPVVNGVASGLAFTRWQDNAGSTQAYSAPFTLAEGAHALSYQSQDNVANLEVLRSTNVWVDATPPVTTFAFGKPCYQAADGTNYVTSTTSVTFSATDPALPTGQPGSGVNRVEVAIDGGAFVAYVSSLTFAEGRHVVLYRSIDNVGNIEAAKTLALQSDATQPVTALAQQGGHQFPGPDTTSFFASPDTRFAFPAADPVVNNVASGLSVTRWGDNGGAWQTFTAPFALAEGVHHLAYQSQDNVQNLEVLRSTTVLVDATPPLTQLAIVGGRQFPGPLANTFYASSDTRFALPAVDPVVGGSSAQGAWSAESPMLTARAAQAGEAVGGLLYAVGGVAAGSNSALGSVEAYDPVANAWTAKAGMLTPRMHAAAASVNGVLYAAGGQTSTDAGSATGALEAYDPATNAWTAKASMPTPRTQLAVAVVNGLVYAVGGYRFGALSAVEAFDPAANAWTAKASLGTARFNFSAQAVGGLLYVFGGSDTSGRILGSVEAYDPATNAWTAKASMPTPRTRTVAQVVNGKIYVAGGVDAVTTYSTVEVYDPATNSWMTVAPMPTARHTGSAGVINGRLHVAGGAGASGAILATLEGFTPPAPGVASGVAATRYQDNGSAFQTFGAAFSLAEGAHALSYQSQDNVANLEILRSTNIWVDATPSVTTFAFGKPYYQAPDGTNYVTPATPLSFAAADPNLPTGQAGSGVARIEVAIDGGAFATYTSSLTFAEGRHNILYRSIDNVGNVEATRTLALRSDATPPVTALSLQGGHQFPGPDSVSFFASADTRFAFPAVDPVVNNVASGLAFTRWGDNSGAWQTFTAPVSLAEGVHHLAYKSQDNVQNLEVPRSTAALVDATPPLTQLAIVGGRQFAGPSASTFYASSDTRLSLPAVDPLINGVASGLAATRWQDNNGAFQAFVSSFALAEGAHVLGYQSQDNVANLEVLRSTNIWVDATPSVTTFAFGKPYYQASDGTNYVTPATPLSFTASDPALPTGQPGSGVNHIEVAVDGVPFAPYAAPLTFAEGRHVVLYRSIDNVGNVEAAKTLALQSDATPPVTTLALQGGHQFPGPDAVSFFASADTRFAFPATDPVVNNVASGLAFTRWGDNSGAWQTFTSPIALAEGIHHLSYQSQDNVQNLEVARSTTALVDATPPLTQLAVVGGRQFPGPDAVTFYASSDTRLGLPAADPVVNGVASGLAWTRWQDNNGAFQAFVSSFGLAEGAHTLGYQSQDNVANLEVLRSTNVWVDATPPVTTFAFGAPYYQAPDGTNYVTPATPLSFVAADPNLPTGQPGSGVNHIEVAVDGTPFAPYAAPLTFAEGRHSLLYRAVDNVGNVEAAHALALRSDATPPISSLLIGQPQYQLASVLLVNSRTPFSIAAVDPVVNNVASGVKDTFYRVSDVAPSTAAFGAFSAPFAMSGLDVTKVIEFYSRDHVLNTEVVKSSTVLLDSTPPEISLLSPAACDAGICRVLKGKFPVLGTARDLHFAGYVLDAAPGQDATAGFAQISSGSVAVSSGTLGVWDASKFSGWQTLRLTATDLVQNVSVLALNVWVGDPAALMVLGNHDTFNMPTGVAVSSSGAIYVADREADRVQVFSSTGALLATFGGHPHDSDDHGPALSTGTLRLHEPAGVAVDAAGNIFVADTDDNRVLMLSPSGQVLLELGRKTAKHDDEHGTFEREEGRGPGEFHEPLGVAVDAAGVLYVADTGNRRVQVFSSSGAFVLQFALPPVPQPRDDDDSRDHDSDDSPALGKPAGIALDAAGKIYVADPPGRRALVYTSTGALLLTVPIVGDKPGRTGRPYGVAVSSSGDCLLVSDQKLDRVLKFDFQGSNNLAFGVKGLGDDDKNAAAGTIVFRKPAGLALDAAGNLYVADRNNESVKVFGLPNGRPTLIVPPPKPGDDLSARQVVDRDDGGTVARGDKASVAVPPQALAQDLKITVAPPASGAADDNSRRKAQEDGQLKVASPPVEFSPEGTKFATPATLTIPYNPDLVAAQNVSEDDLKINYWNRDKRQWEAFDSTVDKVNHTVTAKTGHFSLYQVLSSTPSQVAPAAGPAADPTFTPHAVYAFPNPAVKGAKPTIHVAVGVADEVTIKVYDVAGQEVAHASMYGTPPVIDDGSGPQYAYEWVWDGRIASGMYFFVVEASKAGYPKIRKAGKLGVVR